MLTPRKILLTLLVLGGIVGVGWVGKVLWVRHERTVYFEKLAQARALRGQARYAEAEVEYRAAFALAQRVLGPTHPKTLGTQIEFSNVLYAEGHIAEVGRLVACTWEGGFLFPQDYRAPSRLTELLVRLHLHRPTTHTFLYFVSLEDTPHRRTHLYTLEPEGRVALAELLIRNTIKLPLRSGMVSFPPSSSHYRYLAGELQKQGRYEEAITAARVALNIDEPAKKPTDWEFQEDQRLIRELEEALQRTKAK